MKRSVSLVLLVLAALAIAITPAFGKGPKGGTGGAVITSASVIASPNPAAADGTRVYLKGCGYAFAPVVVRVRHSAGYTEEFWVGMWSTGCMSNAYFVTREAGTYSITVHQSNGSTLEQVASTTLDVV